MRLYRVEKQTEADNHQGFEWFTREKDAEKEAKHFRAENLEAKPRVTVRHVEVPTNKALMVQFLNRYASHPDNG